MLGVTLGSLYVDTSVYVPALLKNLCGMSCSGAYCLLGGGWFWCRYGGFCIRKPISSVAYCLSVRLKSLCIMSKARTGQAALTQRFR